MNSIASIMKIKQSGPSIPSNSPHLLYSPIISYVFDSSDVVGGKILNYADVTYDLQLKNTATVGTFGGKKCLVLNNPSLLNPTNNGPYAQITSNKYLTTSTTYTNITFSFWVYHQSIAPSNSNHWSWGDNTNYMLSGFSFANAGRAKFGMNASTVTAASTTFAINTWYHICIVSSGTSATMYVNGSSLLTQSGTITINGNRASQLLSIGASSQWNSDPCIYGYIANFRLYGRALNTTEINNIYTLGIQ